MLQWFLAITHMRLCTFWLLLSDSIKLVQLDLHSLERERQITSNKWLVKASCCVMWIIEPKLAPNDWGFQVISDVEGLRLTPILSRLLARHSSCPSCLRRSRRALLAIFPRNDKDEVSQECLLKSMWWRGLFSADQRAPYGFPCCSLM